MPSAKQLRKGNPKKGQYVSKSRKRLMRDIHRALRQQRNNPQQHHAPPLSLPDYHSLVLPHTSKKNTYIPNDQLEDKIHSAIHNFNWKKSLDSIRKMLIGVRKGPIKTLNAQINKQLEFAEYMLEFNTNVIFYGLGSKLKAIEQLANKLKQQYVVIYIKAQHTERDFPALIEDNIRTLCRTIPLGRFPRHINQMPKSVARTVAVCRFVLETQGWTMVLIIANMQYCATNPILLELVYGLTEQLGVRLLCHTDIVDFPMYVSQQDFYRLCLCFIELNTYELYGEELDYLRPPVVYHKAFPTHCLNDLIASLSVVQLFANKSHLLALP